MYSEKNGEEGVGNEYALCPLDLVRGNIHVVCADDILEFVCNSAKYERSLTRTIGLNVRDTLEEQLFHVNRFYHGDEKWFHFDDDDDCNG